MKYPRTHHLPWSESNSSDDVWWKDSRRFVGKEVVVTEKLDGECTGMTQTHCHARSLDSKDHPSRHWVKRLHGQIAWQIPDQWKLFGENLYACHSIFYADLPGYFFLFGVYDGNNICRSWDETVELAAKLALPTAPILYRGVWDERKVREMWSGEGVYPTFEAPHETPSHTGQLRPCTAEGYVVRIVDEFPYDQFCEYCAKYVRKNHVQTDSHWLAKPVVPNLLKISLDGR